ncbi:MAG: AI-2E family transporter, partial [Synergistaceae bacterium]|nr:AI-2E family transporter [Synergistaceae bacterium]
KNILATISEQVSHYLGTLTLISVVTGICAWVVLTMLGVQLAAGWGVLTVLLNFIPTVGSIIATIPPVVMAIIQFSPGFFKPLLVLVLLTTIQVVIGNVITPKVVGDRLGVSPVMILLSLLLWGMIWGIPGMLLSVPIISIIKIVCENIPQLWPIAILMGTGEAAKRAVTPSIITRRAEIKKLRFLRAQNEENAKELEKLNNLNNSSPED